MQSRGLASYFQGETLQVVSKYLTKALNVCLERVSLIFFLIICPAWQVFDWKSSRHSFLHSSSSSSSSSGSSLFWQEQTGSCRLHYIITVTTTAYRKSPSKCQQKMRFSQLYELLQHSGSYCKDLYIAQTKLDNIYALRVRTCLICVCFASPPCVTPLQIVQTSFNFKSLLMLSFFSEDFSTHTCCGSLPPHTFITPLRFPFLISNSFHSARWKKATF